MSKDKTAIGGKWVFAIKGKGEDPICKAKYVARGFRQVEGIDLTETFSPTARMESIRMLVQIAIQNDWLFQEMDVKGAYLHAPIECDVYVQQPPGCQQTPKLVWKLKKSLYGLKQSGRNWHNLLHQYLQRIEFIQSNADPCVFIQKVTGRAIILLVWVDDIIITSNSKELMDNAKIKLEERLNMKDLGEISSFLGIDFQRTNQSIIMSQTRFLNVVLQRFGYYQCKPTTTPFEVNPDSYNGSQETAASSVGHMKKYRQMVGDLVYAMNCTSPDLRYCVKKLSQNLSKPQDSNWVVLKHVFRFIHHAVNYKLTFEKSPTNVKLVAYCDADWASPTDDRPA